LFRLARAAEHKDGETGAHMQRVGAFSAMIAEAMGCPPEYCEILYKAAQMHDIGKIGIHESILRKSGPLTSDEWRLMREHPRIGASILAGSEAPVLQLAAEVSMAHHEHFSGAGYPQGLVGERSRCRGASWPWPISSTRCRSTAATARRTTTRRSSR
jgi:response regulator RpfG family c-di-GMP phosphodiesterase